MAITKTEMLANNELVQKYIGSDYDTVKKVADALPLLTDLSDEIEELNNTYQGSLTEEPVTRPDGTPIKEGDRYYNSITKQTYVFSNGQWIGQNTLTTSIEYHEITAENIVGSDTVVTLNGLYAPGKNNILVYVSQAFQYSQSVDPSGAYVETDEKTITFPNTILQEGEIVNFVIGQPLTTVNPDITLISNVYFVETVNQALIPLPEGMQYVPFENNLSVYVNGRLKASGINYEETSPVSITLYEPVQPGDEIIFQKGELISNGNQSTTTVQTVASLNSVYDSRDFLVTNKPLLISGGYTIGDGSGGLFIYDATVPKKIANGATIIDAQKPFSFQGEGEGFGCWVRQYEQDIKPAWFNTPKLGAECLKFLKPIQGDRVDLKGFYENTTDGSGVFYFEETMSALNHNGGTIISPAVIAFPGTPEWFIAPSSGQGCWVRENTDVDVLMFGAKRNQAYDSSLSFNKAAEVSNPKVPLGDYTLDSAVTGNFYSFGEVTLSGSSSGSVIKNLLATEE